jgi:competence protein ComEC
MTTPGTFRCDRFNSSSDRGVPLTFSMQRPRLIPLLLAALLAGATRSASQAVAGSADTLLLHFIDVGQGDATLVTLGRRAVLVDAGRGRDIVLVLADYQVDSLVAAIASHNHDDHIGGMVAVVADIPIGRFYSNGRPPTNANARDLEFWLARKGIARPPPPWAPIRLGDVTITVFPSLLDPTRASENDYSLGVLIERGSFRALLTGDSERGELSAWLAGRSIPRVSVLKAAHHGALNGVSAGWLDRTKPEIVVISVGANNDYGHPDPLALRYYGLHRRPAYRTDRDGTVSVAVDPDGQYRVTVAGPTAR